MGKQERRDCTDFTMDCATAWGTLRTCFSSSSTLISSSSNVFRASLDHSPPQSHLQLQCRQTQRKAAMNSQKIAKLKVKLCASFFQYSKKMCEKKKNGTRLFQWEIFFWRFMFFLTVLAFWGLPHPPGKKPQQNKT